MLMNVVFPAPFGPISACRAPSSSRNSMLSATVSAPKLLQSARVSRTTLTRLAPSFSRARSTRPSSPPRANITITISSTPIPSVQYSGDCFAR